MIRITAPHFCAGAIPGVRAAPIIKYMSNWTPDRILAYCTGKGWHAQLLPDDLLEQLEERAAIREHLGGYARGEAERLALEDTMNILRKEKR